MVSALRKILDRSVPHHVGRVSQKSLWSYLLHTLKSVYSPGWTSLSRCHMGNPLFLSWDYVPANEQQALLATMGLVSGFLPGHWLWVVLGKSTSKYFR